MEGLNLLPVTETLSGLREDVQTFITEKPLETAGIGAVALGGLALGGIALAKSKTILPLLSYFINPENKISRTPV